MRDRIPLLLAAAGLLLGVAAIVLWIRRNAPTLPRNVRPAVLAAAPDSEPPTARSPERGASRLYASITPADFDELMAVFRQLNETPTARDFAEEFLADRELKELWVDYREGQLGADPPSIEAFGRKLGASLKFRQLVERFTDRPPFSTVVQSVQQASPRLAEAYRALVKTLRVSASPASAGMRSARGSLAKVLSASGRRRPSPAPSPGAAGAAKAGGPTQIASDASNDGHGLRDRREVWRGDPKPEAHETVALKAVGPAGRDIVAGQDFFSRCFRADSGITQTECSQIADHLGNYDLWGSCFASGLFDKCKSLCATASCGQSTFFDACLQSKPAPECRALCSGRGDCPPAGGSMGGSSGGGAGAGGSTGGGDSGPTGTGDPGGDGAGTGAEPPPGPEICYCCDMLGCEPGGCVRGPGTVNACLAEGTPVSVPGGERRIEALAAGELVLSVDPRTGSTFPVRVLAVAVHSARPTLKLTLEDGREIRATAEHPLFDPEAARFRPAGEYRAGDLLAPVDADGLRRARVLSVEDGGSARVVDLTVEGPHHDFVAGGVLVHNKWLCAH